MTLLHRARATLAVSALGIALTAALGVAQAAEVTLRAVSAWPEKNFFSINFEKFVERVNQEGKGVVQIQYLGGGAKVMPPFEVGNAVRNGVVDMANVTGNFYTNLLPESDALSLANIPVQEQRKNGAMDYVNKIWGEKMNVFYLGRSLDMAPYHIFLKKPIDKPSLAGLRLRGIPIYREFIQSLGGSVITLPPNELYTALERNVVDGYGWPITGIFDVALHEHTKYRVDPGFYNVEVGVLVNRATWNRLDDKQKDVLQKAALWMEDLNLDNPRLFAEEKARHEKAGIKAITFEGEQAKEYLSKAYDAIWAAMAQRSPQHGSKMKELLYR
jgi:TRAP-type transport system periplasmic protein